MFLHFRYTQARAAIDSIFGPKCHKKFPRLYRLSNERCSRDGFYPSKLGSGNREYKHTGIDLIHENGKKVFRFLFNYLQNIVKLNCIMTKPKG